MKNHFTILLPIIVFVLSILSLQSDSFAEDAESIELALTSKFFSEYVGPGGAIWHDEPVIQTDLMFSFPNGFYFNLWHSTGFNDNDFSSDYADEIDYTVGWCGNLKSFGFDVGVIYFDFIELFNVPDGDFIQPYFEVNKEFVINNDDNPQNITPFLRIVTYLPAKGSSPEKGIRIYHGIRHSFQISPKVMVNQKFELFYDDGSLDFDKGFVGDYSLNVDLKVVDGFSFSPLLIKLYSPLTASDMRKTEFIYGISASIIF